MLNKKVHHHTGLVAVVSALALAVLTAGLPAFRANADLAGTYATALQYAADANADGVPDIYQGH